MVNGLQQFKNHFCNYNDSYIVIGGVACDTWMTSKSLSFRLTKDIDMVLLMEVLNTAFVNQFWTFIKAGEYQKRQKSERKREYYRFSKPKQNDYPAVIELFSRQVDNVKLDQGQGVTPIPIDDDISSLSAILMNDDYYNLVKSTRTIMSDLPVITPDGLIPLKAKAWLDLMERKSRGERIDQNDITKHMKDIFKLTATLTGSTFILPDSISNDLGKFVDFFPADASEWRAITSSMRAARIPEIEPTVLVNTLKRHFGLKTGN